MLTLRQTHCKTCQHQISLQQLHCCSLFLCSDCTAAHSCSKLAPTDQMDCARCGHEKGILACAECEIGMLCTSCDAKVHKRSKFMYHHRNGRPISMEALKAKELPQISDSSIELGTLSISQAWGQVLAELQTKFQEILDQLQDKKNQILSKIAKRRNKEIEAYQQLLNQRQEAKFKVEDNKTRLGDGMRKSQILQSIDRRLQNLQFQNSQRNDRRCQVSVANSQFESLKGAIERMDVKGLILRINNQPERLHKSKMRSSAILTSPYGGESPLCRTPKHAKHRITITTLQRQSMPEEESKNQLKLFEDSKMTEQKYLKESRIMKDSKIMKESKNLKEMKQSKILKVKSEKVLSSASGLKSYFKEKLKKKGY